jgi:hypothetical protein
VLLCAEPDCPELFHRRSPKHRYCDSCARRRHAEQTAASASRLKRQRRSTREQAAVATSAARRSSRALSLPNQPTLPGTL